MSGPVILQLIDQQRDAVERLHLGLADTLGHPFDRASAQYATSRFLMNRPREFGCRIEPLTDRLQCRRVIDRESPNGPDLKFLIGVGDRPDDSPPWMEDNRRNPLRDFNRRFEAPRFGCRRQHKVTIFVQSHSSTSSETDFVVVTDLQEPVPFKSDIHRSPGVIRRSVQVIQFHFDKLSPALAVRAIDLIGDWNLSDKPNRLGVRKIVQMDVADALQPLDRRAPSFGGSFGASGESSWESGSDNVRSGPQHPEGRCRIAADVLSHSQNAFDVSRFHPA